MAISQSFSFFDKTSVHFQICNFYIVAILGAQALKLILKTVEAVVIKEKLELLSRVHLYN